MLIATVRVSTAPNVLAGGSRCHVRYGDHMPHWGKPIALGLGIGWAVVILIFYTRTAGSPVDAACYYEMVPAGPGDLSQCFLYSPPIAQLMLVTQAVIPFDAFYTTLRVLDLIVLAVVAGPAIGPALFIPAVAIEINAANINLLLVGAVLLGFRFPGTWAFVILTKVTPGIGLLWFAVRREWRHLAIALAATMVIAGISVVLAPWMWGDYVQALAAAQDDSPYKIWWRLPIAVAVVVWGARTDRRWTVIVAVFLAMPRWYFLTPVILIGLFPLVRFPRPLPWMRWGGRRMRQTAAATSDGRKDRAPSS